MDCLIATAAEYQTRAFAALLEMLRWFGGQQIRNVAVSLCGNNSIRNYTYPPYAVIIYIRGANYKVFL